MAMLSVNALANTPTTDPLNPNLRPSSSQHGTIFRKKDKSYVLTCVLILSLASSLSFPFVSSISSSPWKFPQSSLVKAVCSAYHQHFYRSAARQWWFVPVLRQNDSLPLSRYRLLPLSGAIPPADTKKEEENIRGGEDGGISPNCCMN